MRRSSWDHLLLALLGLALAAALFRIWRVGPGQPELGGVAQKIFYLHVPSAWTAMNAFLLGMVAAVAYLRTRRETWDQLGEATIEVGMVFATLVLCTGPIWARPVWGRYWNAEPRLLSFAVMWSMYAAYLVLRRTLPAGEKRAAVSAAYCVVAALNIPLVYFSVRLVAPGQQLHPKEFKADPAIGQTLLTSFLAFTLLWLVLLLVRWRLAAAEAGIERRRRERAERSRA